MLKPLLLHWRILSYSFVLLCLSCMPSATAIRIPPPTSIPTAIPAELRIGKVDVEGEWIRLTPEQASKLAAQVKYLQQLAEKSYLLGRSEGIVALDAQIVQTQIIQKTARYRILYGLAGSFMIGLGVGFILDKADTNE